ncbi:MAG: hypothetical protein HQL25_06415 [Candidatus Omnitrophica bacterium]|nr:hypothetical protein [Candidatus Omnitrophota bacterium]
MKKFFILLFFIFFTAQLCIAANTEQFMITAFVPNITRLDIGAYTMAKNAPQTFNEINATQELNFGTLVYQTDSEIYLPDKFFVVDVNIASGTSGVATTVQYTEGTAPAGQVKTLGYKGKINFAKVKNGVEFAIPGHAIKYFNEIKSGDTINIAQGDGFLRLYIGIIDGSETADLIPRGAETFKSYDKAGTYTGTITVTAVAP